MFVRCAVVGKHLIHITMENVNKFHKKGRTTKMKEESKKEYKKYVYLLILFQIISLTPHSFEYF